MNTGIKPVLCVIAAGVASMLLVLGPAADAGAAAQTRSATRTSTAEAQVQEKASATDGRKLYDYRFHVKPNNARVVGVAWKPGLAISELKRCFNCTFPVKGAPKKYPAENQKLDLKACASYFVCKNAPVRYHKGGIANGWYFTAEQGHFDGKGSRVSFQYYSEKDTHYLMLHVRAYVTHPAVPDSLNKRFAYDAWQDFSHNMGVKLWCKSYGSC